MLKLNLKSKFQMQLQTILIICSALILGATVFALLICFITDWEEVKPIGSLGMLPMMGLVFGGMMMALSLIVSIVSRNSSLRQLTDRFASPELFADSSPSVLDEDETLITKLLGVFQTSMVIRFAMIEGAVFLNLMLFMIERNPLNLILAGFGLLFMLMMLPFSGRVWNWVETALESMQNHARGR